MANGVYDAGRLGVMNAGIDFVNNTIKVRLVPSSYSFDATHATMTAVGSGIGTDQTLASKATTSDGTNHFCYFTAANPTWTAVAGGSTIGAAVVYKFVTNDAGSTPICFLDVTDTATNGSDITISFASNGNGGIYKIA